VPSDFGDTIVWLGHNNSEFWYRPRPYTGDDNTYDFAKHEIWLDPKSVIPDSADADKRAAVLLAHELTHMLQYLMGEKWKDNLGLLEGEDVWDEIWARLIQWKVEAELGIELQSAAPGDFFIKQAWKKGDLALMGLKDYIADLYWELPELPNTIDNNEYVTKVDRKELENASLVYWPIEQRLKDMYTIYSVADVNAYTRFIEIIESPGE
jgi:hypothetical protein